MDLQPLDNFGGFVTAVDAGFDPNDPGEHAEESPDFSGRMRILGNLLWSDLFALGKAQAASAEDLWPLAMHHPWQVCRTSCTQAKRAMGSNNSEVWRRLRFQRISDNYWLICQFSWH
jgi:hypothetical protein